MSPFSGHSSIPILSRETVRELDRTAMEHFGIPGLVLMENASRAITNFLLAELTQEDACRHVLSFPFAFRDALPCVLIFCGTGNNAGDGLAVARHLQLRKIPHRVLLCAAPDHFKGDALFQYQLAQKLGLEMIPLFDCSRKEDVWQRLDAVTQTIGGEFYLVDALLGTGASGPPRFPMNAVIPWMNHYALHGSRILAIDVPTGLDCESGKPFVWTRNGTDPDEATVHAGVTVTLAAAKPGLVMPEAAPYVGELRVSDIGISVDRLLAVLRKPEAENSPELS